MSYTACELDEDNISYVVEPTLAMQEMVVRKDGMLIRHIKEPSETLCKIAVLSDSFNILLRWYAN